MDGGIDAETRGESERAFHRALSVSWCLVEESLMRLSRSGWRGRRWSTKDPTSSRVTLTISVDEAGGSGIPCVNVHHHFRGARLSIFFCLGFRTTPSTFFPSLVSLFLLLFLLCTHENTSESNIVLHYSFHPLHLLSLIYSLHSLHPFIQFHTSHPFTPSSPLPSPSSSLEPHSRSSSPSLRPPQHAPRHLLLE